MTFHITQMNSKQNKKHVRIKKNLQINSIHSKERWGWGEGGERERMGAGRGAKRDRERKREREDGDLHMNENLSGSLS